MTGLLSESEKAMAKSWKEPQLGRIMSSWKLPAGDGKPYTWENFKDARVMAQPNTIAVASAFAMATAVDCLANGGEVNGVRVLREETLKRALDCPDKQYMVATHAAVAMVQGGWADYDGTGDKTVATDGSGTYGWEGTGGSSLKFNAKKQLAWSYATTGWLERPGWEARVAKYTATIEEAARCNMG